MTNAEQAMTNRSIRNIRSVTDGPAVINLLILTCNRNLIFSRTLASSPLSSLRPYLPNSPRQLARMHLFSVPHQLLPRILSQIHLSRLAHRTTKSKKRNSLHHLGLVISRPLRMPPPRRRRPWLWPRLSTNINLQTLET